MRKLMLLDNATLDGYLARRADVNAAALMPIVAGQFDWQADLLAELTSPFRAELLAHCYRMTGSVHDSEDLLQETMLRAWRAFGSFERRAGMRTWLYRIATNVCLNALTRGTATPRATRRTGRRCYRFRRSASACRARGRMAGTAALLRARRAIAAVQGDEPDLDDPGDPTTLALLDRYVAAFEQADMTTLAELLRSDAEVQMPPHSTWFRGREPIVRFFAARVTAPGQVRIVRTRANGQPALATYLRTASGGYAPNSVHLISSASGRIKTIVAFVHPAFLDPFLLLGGLPATGTAHGHRAPPTLLATGGQCPQPSVAAYCCGVSSYSRTELGLLSTRSNTHRPWA